MRLRVDHRTTYRFSVAQSRIVQLLRMTPTDTDQQTVADWGIHVDCDARLRDGHDGFGNRVSMLYAEGPIDAIEIAVSGEVLTTPSPGLVSGASEPFPVALYQRATTLTMADDTIATFAREAMGHAPLLDGLHALNRAVNKRFPVHGGRPVIGQSAIEAFAAGAATARDTAHIFIAAARSQGAAARYVSGYSLIAAKGQTQPTPHGWAEAWVDGLGWVGFDPGMGLCAAEEYVRVAVGLDAASAAPVAGSRLGDGQECLDVDITIGAVARDDQ